VVQDEQPEDGGNATTLSDIFTLAPTSAFSAKIKSQQGFFKSFV
jgi:hypothetical protein